MEKSTLYSVMDLMGQVMDTEEMLTALAMALDVDTLEDMLAFIIRCHEVDTYGWTDQELKLINLPKEKE